MASRRAFVKSAALLSAGALVSPALLAAAPKQYIGLQLYTVRDAMQQDPAGTLAKVAQMGYNSVEGATYTGSQKFYGMEPAAFAKVLKQNGLIMPSSHYVLGEAMTNGQPAQGTILHGWDKAVDDAAQVGAKYMVCAYLQESERGDLNHYKQIAAHLNKAGERCKKAGIQLCYHNHDFEFAAQNGQLPYDILLKETDKQLLKMELDLYWAPKPGTTRWPCSRLIRAAFRSGTSRTWTRRRKRTLPKWATGSLILRKSSLPASSRGCSTTSWSRTARPATLSTALSKASATLKVLVFKQVAWTLRVRARA
jgi:hypothetical protein